ncbi:hypothetical protein HZS_6025 [Henneguya salminicola]|nr:hypothetical protein HZS_6025 [Henneguya salminicola]
MPDINTILTYIISTLKPYGVKFHSWIQRQMIVPIQSKKLELTLKSKFPLAIELNHVEKGVNR